MNSEHKKKKKNISTGSFVPFTLFVLKAELPYYLKISNSLDPLYKVLSICRKEVEQLKANSAKIAKVTRHFPDIPSLTKFSINSTSSSFGPLSNFTMDEIFFGSYEGTK